MKFHVHVYKVVKKIEYDIYAEDYHQANQIALNTAGHVDDNSRQWQEPETDLLAMVYEDECNTQVGTVILDEKEIVRQLKAGCKKMGMTPLQFKKRWLKGEFDLGDVRHLTGLAFLLPEEHKYHIDLMGKKC